MSEVSEYVLLVKIFPFVQTTITGRPPARKCGLLLLRLAVLVPHHRGVGMRFLQTRHPYQECL
jgi:hypothetical protein